VLPSISQINQNYIAPTAHLLEIALVLLFKVEMGEQYLLTKIQPFKPV
jgi:hypothetical protein